MPRRRAKDVLVETLSDETVVYDTKRHKAHCLNEVASLVWSRCDGRTTVAATAQALRDELGLPADERLVRSTVVQLERLGLLEVDSPRPTVSGGPRTRRELARLLAFYGISTTLIVTIAAPPAAAAASCLANGQVCMRSGVVLGKCCAPLTCSQVMGNRIKCR